MISFIVIGKNEGWRLSKCIESIYNVVVSDHIDEFEIIYIDSKSSDDSIKRVLGFNGVKIFEITGECNAAIGRNIGGKESRGSILFFIDGDMQLLPGAVSSFLNERKELIHPFCTGLFENHFYNENWEFIEKRGGNYTDLINTKNIYQPITGGLFLITKKLWDEIGGMDTRFVRGQDIDLGLRLSKKGILQLKKNVLIVHHYTISYLSEARIKVFNQINATYYRGLLLRKNLFNKNYYKYGLRSDYTGFCLFFCLLLSALSPFSILIYFFLLLLRGTVVKIRKVNSISLLYVLKDYFYRDLNLFIAFFFFYPKQKQINYKRIN
jgi:glycosyltransferase involved in cell wall biosynthesis